MSEPSNKPCELQSIEELGNTLLSNAQQSIRRNYKECEQRIRKSPTTSILSAVAGGYLLHRLPVRALVVAHVRLISALAPPALFLFGAAKLYEFWQKQDSNAENHNGG